MGKAVMSASGICSRTNEASRISCALSAFANVYFGKVSFTLLSMVVSVTGLFFGENSNFSRVTVEQGKI